MDTYARHPHHRFHQQLAGPRRPTPAIVLRRRPNDLVQLAQILFVQLVRPIISSTIPQTRLVVGAEAFEDPLYRGVVNLQNLLRLTDRTPVEQINDDQIPSRTLSLPHRRRLLSNRSLTEKRTFRTIALMGIPFVLKIVSWEHMFTGNSHFLSLTPHFVQLIRAR